MAIIKISISVLDFLSPLRLPMKNDLDFGRILSHFVKICRTVLCFLSLFALNNKIDLELFHRMADNSLQFFRRRLTRVAQVDLVVTPHIGKV